MGNYNAGGKEVEVRPAHSVLGGSSCTRWLTCPGSIGLIEGLPIEERDSPPSKYADEGTVAHSFAEKFLKRYEQADAWVTLGGCHHGLSERSGWRPIGSYRGEMLQGRTQMWEVTDEMIEAVSMYLDEINSQVTSGCAKIWVEKQVYPVTEMEGTMWGTADAVVYNPEDRHLFVTDLKYGRGLVVDPEWNDQELFYGCGALKALEATGAQVDKVTLVIVQPRAYHPDGPVRRWTIDVRPIRHFSDVLRAGAEAAQNPDAHLKAGDHCRFCPAKARCPEVKKIVDEIMFEPVESELPAVAAPRALSIPDVQEVDKIAYFLEVKPIIEGWLAAMDALAHRAAIDEGILIPGTKVVRSRGRRAWKDPEDAERRLRNKAGIKVSQIVTTKLKTPTQIGKIVGDKWVNKHSQKPKGTPKLVPESDARRALEPDEYLFKFPEIESEGGS